MPLGATLTLLKDGTHGTHKRSREGIPLLSAKNISSGGKIVWTDDDDRISHEDFESIHRTYRLEQDDVLLTVVGTLGRAAILKTREPFTIQRSVAVLRADRSVVLPEFLFHRVRSDDFVAELHRRSNATAQSGVYLGQLEKIETLVPPLAEQRKIAAILFSIDETIDSTARVVEQLVTIWKVLLDHLMTRGGASRRSDLAETGLGNLPSAWAVSTFGELCSKIVDGVHQKPDYQASGIPFITVKNLTAGRGISFEDVNFISEADHGVFSKRANPERGDILLSKDGTLGVPRVVDTDRPFSIFVSVALLKPIRSRIEPWFMRYALESRAVSQHFGVVQAGQALKHIHLRDLRATPCPVPPYEEQEEIAETLKVVETRMKAEQDWLKVLRTVKAGLAEGLLGGSIRAPLGEAAA
jgi:type I restriction enzyme S subunit